MTRKKRAKTGVVAGAEGFKVSHDVVEIAAK